VINAAFAQTLALKRSAGLETVACWQTDAQWEPELRDQLDALFAHRVLFATASATDARSAASLLLSEYSDQLRAGDEQLARLASPDVRLHLPRHVALASWTTERGRERPFIATTLPLPLDRERISAHARAQRDRGGRTLLEPQPPALAIALQPTRSAPPEPQPALAQASPRQHGAPPPRAPQSPRRDEPQPPQSPRVVAPQSSRVRAPQSPGVPQRASTWPDRVARASQPLHPPSQPSRRPEKPPGPVPVAPMPPDSTAGGLSNLARPAARPSGQVTRTAQSPDGAPAGLSQSPRPSAQPPSPTAQPPSSPAPSLATTPGPRILSPSHVELLALDAADRARWLPVARARARPEITAPDRELLAWLIAARCALTSQIHRRMNVGRSLTTTQRALKRLADQGLIARFQLHRADGGGVPLCCAATDAAVAALGVSGRRAPELREEALAGLRRDVHVVGWLLALEAAAGDAVVEVLGPGRAAIAPAVPGPNDLRLEHGLRARDFLVTGPDGSRAAVERFSAVRPDAVAVLDPAVAGDAARRVDLLVVLDGPSPVATLEAYDHLLGGWWRSVERYRRAAAPPAVVIVCPDETTARARVALADRLLSACLAEIGVPPRAWRRPGRAGIRFAAEADLHDGSFAVWSVPALPPALRPEGNCEAVRTDLVQLLSHGTTGSVKSLWR
jgi:hypothetical protein